MARSKLFDPVHILQHIYNEDSESINVELLPTEISMELNADDGDSVLVQKQMTVLDDVQDGQLIDTSKASRLCILSEDSNAQVELFAVIGNKNISLGSLSLGQIKEICLPEIFLATNSALIVILQA